MGEFALEKSSYAAATRQGDKERASSPLPSLARFDEASGRIVVEFTNGAAFLVPVRSLQGLEAASDDELAEVELLGETGLHWERLDVDFSIRGLMAGVFGTTKFMQAARRGGQSRSEAKVAAARANGAKGGRPRKAAPPFRDENLNVLHWRSDEDRWENLKWEDWTAFRGVLSPSVGLKGITGGVHHFAVVVLSDGKPVNIIPHKYLIQNDGTIGLDNFGGLTKEERDDEQRIMTSPTMTPADEARLDQIRAKIAKTYHLPDAAISLLRRELPQSPKPGSAAERFLAEHK